MPFTFAITAPGNYTIEDDGIVGNNMSVLRDSSGAVVSQFTHPADSLTFTTTVPGVHLTVNFTDTLGAANFTLGSIASPAQSFDSIVMNNVQTSGLVTLVSNGSITEGTEADAAADIVAGSLVLSAATGIGVPGNALETQVGGLEAETNTGGINLANTGAVTIGGLSADVAGLNVAASGDLVFTNSGTVLLSDTTGPQNVHGGNTSGNVTLIANGVSSDILTNVGLAAVSAPRGSVLLQAGQDVALGTIATNNDVIAYGSITVNAGRDVLLDGDTDVISDPFHQHTGGDVAITAGRNITTSNVYAMSEGDGDLILTTGIGGTLTMNAGSIHASEAIVLSADRMELGSTHSINSHFVTLQPVSAGRAITLGSATDAASAVELSDAELDQISWFDLIIGNNSAGPVTVIAPITVTNATNLIIRSGTDIDVLSDITTPEFAPTNPEAPVPGRAFVRLSALDNVFQSAASTITTGILQVFVDAVDDDPGVGGTATLDGAIAAAGSVINGNLDADTLNGTGQANSIFGFAGDDTLRGFAGNDRLDGGTGNDNLTGGADDDTYVYKTGYAADTIVGFVAGAGTPDKVDLAGVVNAHTLGHVLARSAQFGADTVIDFGNGDTLRLTGVQTTALHADDFIFSPKAKGDLDGDHKSDIVLQNDNGSTYLWEMNGLKLKAHAAGPVVGPEWHVRDHNGDLDGDGKSDVVLQNDNGATYFWEMDGFGAKASGDGPAVAPSWHVKFTGDLDGDGKSDIVLQNDNGQTYFWLMDGLNVKAAAAGPVVNAQWHVAGTGDFDGDGRDDVVLQHDNGQTYFWLMNGLDVKAAAAGPAVAASWHIVGTGDLDGDGRDDVVLQNDSGQTFFWEMNGLAVKAFGGGPAVAPQWHIRDTGDLDGDLKSDIVLQHDNGQTFFWEMDGLSVKAFDSGQTVDPMWHIV